MKSIFRELQRWPPSPRDATAKTPAGSFMFSNIWSLELLKTLNVIQVSISIKWHNRIMIWCEIIFMILCFWNKPLLLTKAAIIWSKIKEKLVKYYYHLKAISKKLFQLCKAEFSVFSVTWSLRNHFNMLICCSRNMYYYHQFWKQ